MKKLFLVCPDVGTTPGRGFEVALENVTTKSFVLRYRGDGRPINPADDENNDLTDDTTVYVHSDADNRSLFPRNTEGIARLKYIRRPCNDSDPGLRPTAAQLLESYWRDMKENSTEMNFNRIRDFLDELEDEDALPPPGQQWKISGE